MGVKEVPKEACEDEKNRLETQKYKNVACTEFDKDGQRWCRITWD